MSILAALALAAAQPVFAPSGWSPTADYVTSGQDEPGYRRWVAAQPWRGARVAQFHRYLADGQVAWVVPTWQLLRTASDWQRCAADPFEVPPPGEWPNIVQTLRFVRDYVVPSVGPVEPVSVYRNPLLNACAGGAMESVHMHLSAVDLVPLRPTSRGEMIARLCAVHALEGPRYSVGLGFYPKLRFHIDSWKYRTWGRNDSGTQACPGYHHAPVALLPILRPFPPARPPLVAPTLAPASTLAPALAPAPAPAPAPVPAFVPAAPIPTDPLAPR